MFRILSLTPSMRGVLPVRQWAVTLSMMFAVAWFAVAASQAPTNPHWGAKPDDWSAAPARTASVGAPFGLIQNQQPVSQESAAQLREQAKPNAEEQNDQTNRLDGMSASKDGLFVLPAPRKGLKSAPTLLSRLWWQASPLELAGGSAGSYLGIGVADVTPQMATKLGLEEARGVVVTAVAEGSPAQKSGLQVKDVVVAYNGTRLESRQQLTRMVGETPAERTVTLSILRGGAPKEVKLTTAARRLNPELRVLRDGTIADKNLFILPDLPRMVSIYRSPMLGIETETLSQQMAAYFGVTEGVLVREVFPESPAAKAGLKAGDVIASLAGEKVVTPADITSVLRAKASSREALALGIVRNQKKLSLTVTPSGDWNEGRLFPNDRGSQWSRK